MADGLTEFELIELERALEGCDSLKDVRELLVARDEARDRVMLEVFGADFRDLNTVLRLVPRLIAVVRRNGALARV